MYLTISKICTVSSRTVLSKTTVRCLMHEPQSCANGMVAFAKVQKYLENNCLLAKKNKIIVELYVYSRRDRRLSISKQNLSSRTLQQSKRRGGGQFVPTLWQASGGIFH